jgi:opacity protein-like surface antigen
MKINFVGLFLLLSAASAQAGIQLETRTFHSNLHLKADKITRFDAEGVESARGSSAYFNTAGLGVAASAPVLENLDVGLGYGVARFYPTTGNTIDLHSISAFSRYSFIRNESSRIYGLAGLSSQQLNERIEDDSGPGYRYSASSRFQYAPSFELGFGGSMTFGVLAVGLEYKYSHSLKKTSGTVKTFDQDSSTDGVYLLSSRTKVKGLTLEGQEAALTLGMSL